MCCRMPQSRDRCAWLLMAPDAPSRRLNGTADRIGAARGLFPFRGVQLTNYSDRDICIVHGVKIYLSKRVETPRQHLMHSFVSRWWVGWWVGPTGDHLEPSARFQSGSVRWRGREVGLMRAHSCLRGASENGGRWAVVMTHGESTD
jgi:hypothetical protein